MATSEVRPAGSEAKGEHLSPLPEAASIVADENDPLFWDGYPEESDEEFRQRALRSSAEYAATGLHLTGEEVDAWLERLENGEDVDPPPCHV